MSKFSNGPMTDFNGPCKRDPVTPIVIDPATQEEIVNIVKDIVTQTIPIGLICNWQVTGDTVVLATMVTPIKPGWHLANGMPTASLKHADGTSLTTGEVAALDAIFPVCHYNEGDPDVHRLPKMDNGIVHTYNVYEE